MGAFGAPVPCTNLAANERPERATIATANPLAYAASDTCAVPEAEQLPKSRSEHPPDLRTLSGTVTIAHFDPVVPTIECPISGADQSTVRGPNCPSHVDSDPRADAGANIGAIGASHSSAVTTTVKSTVAPSNGGTDAPPIAGAHARSFGPAFSVPDARTDAATDSIANSSAQS